MATKYRAARFYIGVLEFFGTLAFILGVLATILMLTGKASAMEVISGITTACTGLLFAAGAQIIKAVVDTADTTNQILEYVKGHNSEV